MALYYSKGKISFISEVKTGTSQSGYQWQNCDVTLEIPGFQGAVTKQVFRASGDKVDLVKRYKVGDNVQIGFTLYAREWNNRLFNNVDLVTITDESGAVAPPSEQDIKFQKSSVPADTPSKALQELQEKDDPNGDLPF